MSHEPCSAWEPGVGHVCSACSSGVSVCTLCQKRLAYCATHEADVQRNMRGHILRVHPESVPESIDKLARDPAAYETFKAAIAPSDPSMWVHFFEVVDKRRRELAS